MSVKLVLVAACALIDADGRVLLAQRPEGKSMAGLVGISRRQGRERRTAGTSLIRELQEELGIVVKEECLAPLTFASHLYPDFHLLMPLYVCRRWEGIVQAREAQRLKWVRPQRSAQLSDAARRRAADSAPDDVVVMPKQEAESHDVADLRHSATCDVICSADFLHDESGATAIEYALIASGVSIAIVGTVRSWAPRSRASTPASPPR